MNAPSPVSDGRDEQEHDSGDDAGDRGPRGLGLERIGERRGKVAMWAIDGRAAEDHGKFDVLAAAFAGAFCVSRLFRHAQKLAHGGPERQQRFKKFEPCLPVKLGRRGRRQGLWGP